MKNKNILVYIYLFVLFLCIVFTIKMSSIVHADSLLEKDAMYLRDKMVKRESTVTTEQQIATESTTEKQEQAKPAKTKIVSMYNISGGIHLTWKKVSDVKYVVYRKSSVSKCYKKVKTTTDSTYEDRNVINGRKYTYKIYTVNSNDMKNVSSSKSIVYVSPTKINKVTSSSTAVYVKFNKVSGVSGYQIKYSPNGEFTNYKLKTIRGYNNTSYKIKGLRSNSMYYVKVRAYKIVSGKTYYSGWGYYKYIKTKK